MWISQDSVASVASCGGGVTVTLPMTILGMVLGCMTICIEVPGRGLLGQYIVAPSVNGFSVWFDNRSYDNRGCFYVRIILKLVNGKY